MARLAFVCEQENVPAETAALEMVARQTTGSLRDALSLLDQLIVYSGSQITLEAVRLMLGVMNTEAVADFVEVLAAGDIAGGLEQINRLVQAGTDLKRFNRELVEHLRNLMLLKANPQSRELTDMTVEAYERLTDQAEKLDLGSILSFLKIFSTVDYNLKVSPYGQLPLELALMECLVRPAQSASVALMAPQPATRPVAMQYARPAAAAPVAPTPIQIPVQTPAAAPSPSPKATTPKVAPVQTPELEPVIVSEVQVEVSSDGVLELSLVVKSWPDAVRSIKAQSAMTAALLEYTKPVAVKGNKISLAFAYDFHRNRISQDATRRNVEEHFSKVVGQRVIIECINQTESSNDDDTPPPSKPAPVSDDYNRKALDIFNAKIV